MKTAERILVTSLALFNQYGESNVSSVDIANELDISPGNLYYHYKGKEVIIAALFDLYQTQLKTLLNSPGIEQLSVQESFAFLYLLLEKAHLFRFLLLNPIDLAVKYPVVSRQYKSLLTTQEQGIARVLRGLVEQKLLKMNPQQQSLLVASVGLILSQGQNYHWLKGLDISDDSHLYHSLAGILSAIRPYLAIESRAVDELFQAIADHQLTAMASSE